MGALDGRGAPAGLEGRVVIVTGASSGIGAAACRVLAAAGARVVAGARRADRLDELIEQITGSGGTALAVSCDVRDEDSARALVHRARDEFGRIDVLVNNAGVMLHSRVDRNLAGQWRQMVETNVLGVLYASGAAIPLMTEGGHIVNISSVAGRKTRPRSGVYSATKFGVNAVSEAMRQELISLGIRVTVIEPGAVATELATHITDEESVDAMRSTFGKIEPLQAEDIADAILWAVTRPPRVAVNEILIRPLQQEY